MTTATQPLKRAAHSTGNPLVAASVCQPRAAGIAAQECELPVIVECCGINLAGIPHSLASEYRGYAKSDSGGRLDPIFAAFGATDQEARQRHALISRRCNAHAALVEALEASITALDSARDTLDGISRRRSYAGTDHYTAGERNQEALESSATEAGDEMSRAENSLYEARAALAAAKE